MNSITLALKSAKVKLPSVRYRIFMWLKDHPEKTAEDVQKALGLSYLPNGALRSLVREKAIKVYKDKSRHTNPVSKLNYMVQRFSTIVASLEDADRKPRAVKKDAPNKVLFVKPVGGTPLTVVEEAKPAKFNPEQYVKPLSLGEARALFDYLYTVFK